ncbi:hypothetical protein GO986_16460 [Deinococcus sp. HMF7620]|uniref:Uncharacterized protein n=1 Tax=Deinococcus arboris TaxID=2682977 RepID=A0A7C9MAL0_9DEIO|nr:hypothetical protein [Deinococcus arboris]MVN88339.1 hypothetical protein [Deinococcus arboris]
MAAMTDEEQVQFARYLRQHIPKLAGQKYHALYTFTEYARQALGLKRLLHWRGLTKAQASAVLAACQAEYPHKVPGQV